MSTIHVVVAVIINQHDQVLIAKRASHQHQGNKWEFPGGKIEKDESAKDALVREIKEEVNLQIQSAELMTHIIHEYEDKKVCLEVYQTQNWVGHALGNEGQPILWVDKTALRDFEFPSANTEIIDLILNT